MQIEINNITTCNNFLKNIDVNKLMLKLVLKGLHVKNGQWEDTCITMDYDSMLKIEASVSLQDGVVIKLLPEGKNTDATIALTPNGVFDGVGLNIVVNHFDHSPYAGDAAFDCILYKQVALLNMLAAEMATALVEFGICDSLSKAERF